MLSRKVALVAASLLFVVGCGGGKSTVNGKVTYNGDPIESGTISFRPPDGKGQVFAARITDGTYEVPEATPGSRLVAIRGMKKVNFAMSSEESARLANEAQTSGKAWAGHLSDPADYIPEDAPGNNSTVEIASGKQTLDFAVTGPPRKK